MKNPLRSLGLLLALGIVLAALASTRALDSFLDPFEALLVLGLCGAGLWSSFGPERVAHAFGVVARGRNARNVAEARFLRAFFGRATRLAWASGFLAAVIGALLALSAMESPGALWSALARSSLGLFYGALLAELVFASLRSWVVPARGR